MYEKSKYLAADPVRDCCDKVDLFEKLGMGAMSKSADNKSFRRFFRGGYDSKGSVDTSDEIIMLLSDWLKNL